MSFNIVLNGSDQIRNIVEDARAIRLVSYVAEESLNHVEP